ncbi:MAG: hypothetical protein ABI241_00515 [Bacteroidia bacterium]
MSYPIPPLINGKSYEWADLIINIMNVPIIGVTSIEYGDKQNMENIWGAGSSPVSRGYGKIEPTAKITLKMEEVQSLMKISPNGSLSRIPEFDISVVFLDLALMVVKHKLRNVRFMNNDFKSKQGDTSIDCELELILSHIEWK